MIASLLANKPPPPGPPTTTTSSLNGLAMTQANGALFTAYERCSKWQLQKPRREDMIAVFPDPSPLAAYNSCDAIDHIKQPSRFGLSEVLLRIRPADQPAS